MHANGRINMAMPLCNAQRSFEIRRTVSRSDRQHILDTRGARSLKNLFAIRIELLVVQMAVRIREAHLLQPRSRCDIFVKTSKHRHSAFHTRRHDHPLRGQSAQLARLEIRHNHHFAPD